MKSNLAPSPQNNSLDHCDDDDGENESEWDNERGDNDPESAVELESDSSLLSPTDSSHQPTRSDLQHTSSAAKKNRMNSKTTLEDVNRSALEYFRTKRATVEKASAKETTYEDPDLSFLMSVLPDMKKMDDNQKRRFKIYILSTAGNILNGIENESHSAIMNNNRGQVVQVNDSNTFMHGNEGTFTELRNITQPPATYGNVMEFLQFQKP